MKRNNGLAKSRWRNYIRWQIRLNNLSNKKETKRKKTNNEAHRKHNFNNRCTSGIGYEMAKDLLKTENTLLLPDATSKIAKVKND